MYIELRDTKRTIVKDFSNIQRLTLDGKKIEVVLGAESLVLTFADDEKSDREYRRLRKHMRKMFAPHMKEEEGEEGEGEKTEPATPPAAKGKEKKVPAKK